MIALISAFNNKNISKGYSTNGQPYIKCNSDLLNDSIYLYYITDTKSVIDGSIRILHALIDYSAELGYL